jgi:glyoxylase-like metal-dependent hydrolase (beta-lactamase superfamily II)
VIDALAIVFGLLGSTDIEVAPQQVPQFEMRISTQKLSDDLYLLEGAGGNVLAYVWDEGVLLVDDKVPPIGARLKAAVAEITTQPIRFVINTHWHPDHRGGNEALAADGAVIVAHENVRRRMSVESFIAVFGRKLPPSPPKALPIVTFTSDVTFHLGGEEISVTHVGAAHTDGDSFVRFRNANVFHLGDCYLHGSFPVIDYSSNGTFAGTLAAVDTALEIADSRTRIIPGHGPVSNAEQLRGWRDMLATIYSRVKTAVAAGKTLAQIKADRPAREWEGRLPQSFVTADHVVEEAFRSATTGR